MHWRRQTMTSPYDNDSPSYVQVGTYINLWYLYLPSFLARSPLDSACLFTTYRNVRLARKHRSFPDKTVLSGWLSRMPILEWQSCLTCLVTVNLPSSRKASYSTSVTWISLHPSSSPYLEFCGLVSSLAKMSPSPLSFVQPYI